MLPRRHIPNAITTLRLVLAAVFFVLLSGYRHGHQSPIWIMPTAVTLFIVAAITDYFDGKLARQWQVESQFGRIMDPLCDKVLVLGAMIFLASDRFAMLPTGIAEESNWGGRSAAGFEPWMVVLILTRELLVTGIRDAMEGAGVKFGANWAGKTKFILQSIAIPTVLAGVCWMDLTQRGVLDSLPTWAQAPEWWRWVNVCWASLTLFATLLSGIPYVVAAVRAGKQ